MFGRNLVPVWIGIILLSSMFLMGQDSWPPQTECAVPEDCNDSNPCTDEDCVDSTCVYTNNTDPCEDGDVCTMRDTCSEGVCLGGGPLDSDGDTYVSDACGGDDCDDGNPDVYPDAPELCDEIDNQCPGDEGYGEVDEGCEKIVFVTQNSHLANFGGIEGADAICQAEADTAGLEGVFLAWLSDSTNSPSTRFTKSSYPYVLANGTVVATDWEDLTDGSLLSPINRVATGGAHLSGHVWTSTTIAGTSRVDNCNNWTSSSGDWLAYDGNLLYSNYAWTDHTHQWCTIRLKLYCFQQ